jgi:hypothetical protein
MKLLVSFDTIPLKRLKLALCFSAYSVFVLGGSMKQELLRMDL